MKFVTPVLIAFMATLGSARIGLGACPTVPVVQNAFGPGGVVSDGLYNIMKIDSQFKWGW